MITLAAGLIVGSKQGLEPTKEVTDGKLERFAIAGADKQWHWATATIDGESVVVKCGRGARAGCRAVRVFNESEGREPV